MTDSVTTPDQPWWRRAWRFWFAWEPMRHAPWETFLFRLGIGWIAWQTLCLPSHRVAQPVPHGMAVWGVDFTWLGDAHLAQWLVPLWGLCLLLYVIDVAPVLTLLPPLVASFGHGTLGNSSGAIGHTTQLVTLVLLASWLAAVWTQICRLRHKPLPFDFTPSQLAADWARQVFMSTYVVSAVSKLVESHGLWFQNAPYFGLQMIKAMGMAQYGAYGPGNNVEGLAQFMLDHPMLAKILVGGALPMELFAFLAVLNRRLALVFGLALYAFHNTVTEVLHLGFVYHKALLLILMVNPVWWIVQIIQRLLNGKRKTENGEPLAARL